MAEFIFAKEKIVTPGEKIGMILQKHTIEEAFQKQQERDQKKDEWCKENNIPLLRIPYTDYEQLDAEYLFSKIPKIGGESNFAFSI